MTVRDLIASHIIARRQASQRRHFAHKYDISIRLRFPAAKVLAAVARAHHVKPEEMKSESRFHAILRARQHGYAIFCELRPDLSLAMIGAILGGRDHTTVLHGRERWKELAPLFVRQAAAVRDALGIMNRTGSDELVVSAQTAEKHPHSRSIQMQGSVFGPVDTVNNAHNMQMIRRPSPGPLMKRNRSQETNPA